MAPLSSAVQTISIVLILHLWTIAQLEASCIKNGQVRCCNGSDSDCYDLYMEGTQPVRCYCDQTCTKRRNCCWDYPLACLDDCITNEWSVWGVCSNDCGEGFQKRTRAIIKAPRRNSSRPCPVLEETRPCRNYQCRAKNPLNGSIRQRIQAQETAHLLPMIANVQNLLSTFDASHDKMRRHLARIRNPQRLSRTASSALQYKQPAQQRQSRREGQPLTTNSHRKMPYCAIYRIVNASESCSAMPDKWNELMHRIHSNYSTANMSHVSSQYTSWRRHGNSLRNRSRICVTCFEHYTQPSAGEMRCPGSGLTSRATKWRTTIIPQCNGYFQLITTSNGCTCPADSSSSFMFQ